MAYGEFTAVLLRSKHRIFSNLFSVLRIKMGFLGHTLFMNKSDLEVGDRHKNELY